MLLSFEIAPENGCSVKAGIGDGGLGGQLVGEEVVWLHGNGSLVVYVTTRARSERREKNPKMSCLHEEKAVFIILFS